VFLKQRICILKQKIYVLKHRIYVLNQRMILAIIHVGKIPSEICICVQKCRHVGSWTVDNRFVGKWNSLLSINYNFLLSF